MVVTNKMITLDKGELYSPQTSYRQLWINKWLRYSYKSEGLLLEISRMRNKMKEFSCLSYPINRSVT